MSDSDLSDGINANAQSGWRLVSVSPYGSGNYFIVYEKCVPPWGNAGAIHKIGQSSSTQ